MAESNYAPVVWMRCPDGTGSMHPCSKGDPGALAYVPADTAEEVSGVDVWPTQQAVDPALWENA